jgi:hypothetical protein
MIQWIVRSTAHLESFLEWFLLLLCTCLSAIPHPPTSTLVHEDTQSMDEGGGS